MGGRRDRRDLITVAYFLAEHNVCSAQEALSMPYKRAVELSLRLAKRLNDQAERRKEAIESARRQ